MRLRCRLGWHKFIRVKVDDQTVESDERPDEDRWLTRCRYCGKIRRAWISRVGGGTGI